MYMEDKILKNTIDKSGLFVVKHGLHFFVVNIVNMTSTIPDYNEVSNGMRNSLDELYFMYVINAPGSNSDLRSLIHEIHLDKMLRKSCRIIHILGSQGRRLAFSKQIVYNKKCSISRKGVMHASIYMCMTHFGITNMKLEDKSRHDNEASVQKYSLIINGQGWYEKHFQAVPDGAGNIQFWEENIQNLDSHIKAGNLEQLEKYMNLFKYEHINILRDHISDSIDDEKKTWRDFFFGYKLIENTMNEVNVDFSDDITLFTPKFIDLSSHLMGFFYVKEWIFHFDNLTEDFSKTIVFKM